MEHFVFSRGAGLSWLLQHPIIVRIRQQHGDHAIEKLCRHDDACLAHILSGSLKGFAAGYSITATVALFRVISSKRKRENLRVELGRLLKDTSIAKFLGVFAFTLKAVNCILRRNRGVDDGFNSMVAGSLAGMTLLTMKPGPFRSDIALYTLSRAVDVVVHNLAGKPPGKQHFHYVWGVFIFMALQAVIMHAFLLEPRNLRGSYNAWISLMAGSSIKEYREAGAVAVQHNEGYVIPQSTSLDGFLHTVRSSVGALELLLSGKPSHSSRSLPSPHVTDDQSQAETAATPTPPGTPPVQKVSIHCSHYHPSCSIQALKTGFNAFRQSLKMYLPLFIVPPIIQLLLRAKTRAGLTLYKATNMLVLKPLLSSLRSALFIGGYTAVTTGGLCLVRRFCSYEMRSAHVLVGAMAGLPILIEKPARYAELNLYCLARAAETLYNTVAEHIGRTSLKFAETPLLDVMVFSWSCAVLFWAMQHQQQMVRASMRSVLSNLLGVN
eukprot:c11854_g1_i1.p1 GENE.c11854_g1_i1~~c11854_g1_i1.p1  ORF type:complete len:494 (+),score=123.40 c11854_g1_i1:233-1714(+)